MIECVAIGVDTLGDLGEFPPGAIFWELLGDLGESPLAKMKKIVRILVILKL